VLPVVEDKHNHCVDALRYGIHALIRNQSAAGYFSRSAMLEHGQPVDPPPVSQEVFAVLCVTERVGTAVGFAIFAASPTDVAPRLIVCDWDLVEIEEALTVQWMSSAYQLLLAVAKDYRALISGALLVERDDFGEAAMRLCAESTEPIGLYQMGEKETLPALDDRCAAIRSTSNRGRVKLGRTAHSRQTTFRSTRTNHLTAQLFAYRPGAPDVAQELVSAFSIGVSLWSPPNALT
jgi:hypothetical protein